MIEELIAERNLAIKSKDLVTANDIKNRLLETGVVLSDTKEGTRWKRNINEYIAMCPKCQELRIGLDSEIIIDLSPQNNMHCGKCETPIRQYIVYRRIGTLEETNAVPRVR